MHERVNQFRANCLIYFNASSFLQLFVEAVTLDFLISMTFLCVSKKVITFVYTNFSNKVIKVKM